MQNSSSTNKVESEKELEQVRALILGENGQVVTDAIKKEARHIVGDVLTEALHDRQKTDGSVNKVLQPLIEDSVEHSVTHHSDRLVSSLYPLMGSLVRKSVTAFLTDFMEKTNQLIDNSLTIKGLTWRVKAWQAGVSFSQYVASQTFVYRVEHVLLIHRETGLLLTSVDLNNDTKSDADLISSMLTAINDFVGDSFTGTEDGLREQLQTVTTDNFNLLIKPGPNALVVAAVTGNPPQGVSDQLQLTLENIHRLYRDELTQFNGDNESFSNAEPLLTDCLLSEQKSAESEVNRIPWFAWVLFMFIFGFIIFQTFQLWVKAELTDKLMTYDLNAGVVVNHIQVNNEHDIEIDILRDPDAVTVIDWLKNNNITIKNVTLTERRYQSLDLGILKIRAERILAQYPQIESKWQGEILLLSGSIALLHFEKLVNSLSLAGFTQKHNLSTEQVTHPVMVDVNSSKTAKEHIFKELIGRITTIQLDFSVESAVITKDMRLSLKKVYRYLEQINLLAKQLDFNVGLLVIGCSDNTGNKVTNTQLSLQRAQSTVNELNQLGFSKEQMYIAGLGQIDIVQVQNNARKVMFNVLYVNNKGTK